MCESCLASILRIFTSPRCVCVCVCAWAHVCFLLVPFPPLCLSAGLFSSMNFHFLPTLWLIGFREATCASRCLWTCTSDVWRFIFSPASWLIINSSSEFWHVQINNHSVKMNMVTSVSTWCTKRRMQCSCTQGVENLMRGAKCMLVCVCIYFRLSLIVCQLIMV